MLAKRVIPCLDVREGRGDKGLQFVGLGEAGDRVEHAARYDREGADQMALLDIRVTPEGSGTLLEALGKTADALSVLLGGGAWGGHAIMAAIDAKRWANGRRIDGRRSPTGLDAQGWAEHLATSGVPVPPAEEAELRP
jgi:imidazole glycerol phosphate synthase subunit HisF